MKLKEGDYVKIIEREQTPADIKSGGYYPYFGGLSGLVDRIYDDSVCVKVEPDTLPTAVLKRHLEIQESIRRKWIDGLSGEARNKLTPEEKRFELSYTILVQMTDLEKSQPLPGKPTQHVKPVELTVVEEEPYVDDSTTAEEIVVTAMPKAGKPRKIQAKDESAKTVTSEDLSEAELAFLREREEALKQD